MCILNDNRGGQESMSGGALRLSYLVVILAGAGLRRYMIEKKITKIKIESPSVYVP